MTERHDHWRTVWTTKTPEEVSWHQPDPARSLELIARCGLRRDAAIVDVGGGASELAGRLLEQGHHHVAVLDISEPALREAAERLGALGDDVLWIESDVLAWTPVPGLFALWHDRAALHFLTTPEERAAYAAVLRRALAPDGFVILATFAPDGPERCSGLPVMRHDGASLSAILGPDFRLLDEEREDHHTPGGNVQRFTWCRFQRVED